jgi:rhamnosyltransferase
VAAVAPIYIERETGLRGAHIQLDRFTYKFLPREQSEPVAVSFLINSMSLWNLKAIRRIGPYSTRLRVDHVDTDYCLRASALGYKLILNASVTFPHSIGNRRKYSFLGRTLQSGGHSSERRTMIARNTVLLAKRYWRRYPSFAVLCGARLGYETLGILISEDDRFQKLIGLASGVLSGIMEFHD